MISYQIYKFLHVAAVVAFMFSLGSLALVYTSSEQPHPYKKLASIFNGVALLVIFVAGFGLLARLGVSFPWPGWIFIKILVWLVLGATLALFKRMPGSMRMMWWGSFGVATIAVFMAILKPF